MREKTEESLSPERERDFFTGAMAIDEEYNEPLLNTSSRNTEETQSGSSTFVEGVVNYKGEKVIDRSKYGGWRSASLLIIVEIAQTFTYFGITSNLISYLTGPLHQSTAVAAENVNAWVGTMWILPIPAAFVADSYLGQFRMIIFSFLIYILGLALLTLSAVLPSLRPPACTNSSNHNDGACGAPTSFQMIFFFTSLYLVAIGNGGFKPCAPAFGADQFDERDPKESKSKSSFFNWWYFGVSFGGIVSYLILNYIQDNLSWGLGFGIPCISIVVALLVLLLGAKTYRYRDKENKENPFLVITRVFIAAVKNRRVTASSTTDVEEVEIGVSSYCHNDDCDQFKFLDKALIDTSSNQNGPSEHGIACTVSHVKDAKAVLNLAPIWFTCLFYGIVVAQPLTFFTKQATTMDRSLTPNIQIPAASLHIFTSLSFSMFIVIYDGVFVPSARAFTGNPNGIKMLHRIGGGILLSSITMAIAAIVEKRRLQTAIDYGLIDMPKAIVPINVWWLVPQYVFLGLTGVFGMVGLQEFFYDQVPRGLRTMGMSIFFSLFGVGSLLSSLLISVIQKATGGSDRYSWFDNNLNRAHLDYFYWLLAGLCMLQFVFFMYFAKSYLYNNRTM